METREPKKGQGVPRETPSNNSIADWQRAVTLGFPDAQPELLDEELKAHGFFDAGMQQQIRLMAKVAVDYAGADAPALIDAFAQSPVEKIRGVAAFVVPLAYADDLPKQVLALHRTGALDGTWPRELSATVLHSLIIQYGVETVLSLTRRWIDDPNPAVRRLLVEALRPRGVMLPHIPELKRDPSLLKPLLEALLEDTSDYVRKAVANNLNDISKDNPEIVLTWACEWLTPDASDARRWIVARGLRTLVNTGHTEALALLGHVPAEALEIQWQSEVPATLVLNQLIPFELSLTNRGEANTNITLRVVVDAPGKSTSRRTYRYHLWSGELGAGQTKQVSKHIHFTDKNSQPKEPGYYRFRITLNGETVSEHEADFER